MRNPDGVPLLYVTRDNNDPNRDPDALKWQVSLIGPKFDRDTVRVLAELQSLLKDAKGLQWIKCGICNDCGRMTVMDFVTFVLILFL